MNLTQVIKRPILSEKSVVLRDEHNQYTFEIDILASKKDVASALASLYSTTPDKVRTHVRRGKYKRRGMHTWKASNKKYAYVTLKQGESLPIFDGQ